MQITVVEYPLLRIIQLILMWTNLITNARYRQVKSRNAQDNIKGSNGARGLRRMSELPWAGSTNPRAYSMLCCAGRYQLGQKTTIVDCVSNPPVPCDLYSSSF